jgi:predicted RNA-binding Zn-ribbon protein involved in translation (DUF1610 family)
MSTTAAMHFCIPCGQETEHEREVTLPEKYRCGDADYEDKTKCGRCGEAYQCQTCGAEFDVTRNECAAVADHGYHGPEDWESQAGALGHGPELPVDRNIEQEKRS